jgi:hypothetical protein
MKYTVIWALDLNEFCDSVNKRLSEGWVLHGDLVATPDGRFLQAMTSNDESETLREVTLKQSLPEAGPLESLIQEEPIALEPAANTEELTKIITALNEEAEHERSLPSHNGEGV